MRRQRASREGRWHGRIMESLLFVHIHRALIYVCVSKKREIKLFNDLNKKEKRWDGMELCNHQDMIRNMLNTIASIHPSEFVIEVGSKFNLMLAPVRNVDRCIDHAWCVHGFLVPPTTPRQQPTGVQGGEANEQISSYSWVATIGKFTCTFVWT